MSQREDEFVDFVLHTISDDLKWLGGLSSGLLDGIDKQFNNVAYSVREALQTSPWIPEQIRPPPPAPPRSAARLPAGLFEQAQGWMHRHRAVTAAVLAFVGTGTFLILHQRRWRRRRRRARRAPTGAKTEVVILAGSAYSPLTQSIAMDLERRGFLVFIPVTSLDEETALAALRLSDVRPLNFDITSPESCLKMLESFTLHLSNPHRHGTAQLHLASLIIVDGDVSTYPTGKIEALPPSLWLDSVSSHIVYPVSLIHTFLPLLLQQKTKDVPSSTNSKNAESSIVVMTESNTPTLQLPYHACESLSSAALAAYVRTLQAELPARCSAVHLRLGAYELEGFRAAGKAAGTSAVRHTRATQSGVNAAVSHGKRVREVHFAVFDAVTGRSSGTVFVGAGARTYALIGAIAPRSLVLWMTGNSLWQSPLKTSWQKWRPQSQGSASGSDSEGTGRSIEWEKVSST